MIEFNYIRECDANEALKYWGNFIIQSNEIHYVAVIKKPSEVYSLEIGKERRKSFDINKYIKSRIKTLSHQKIKNLLRTAPVELRNLFQIKNVPEIQFMGTSNFNIQTINTSKFSITNPKIDVNSNYSKEREKNWFLQGGIKICNTKMFTGTLGGIFTLECFPGNYFGISNWHVIAEGVDLGSAIIQPKYQRYDSYDQVMKHKCGNLFWSGLDKQKEVAFVHLNKDNYQHIKSQNSCGYSLSGKIAPPIVGSPVKKCGITTGCNNNDGICNHKPLYSANSIIKIDDSRYENNPIFENQLLIKKFSKPGDSGSLLVNKNNDVIGLIFTGTINNSDFTVANNINSIFNIPFDVIQKIKFNDTNLCIKEFKLGEFI